ncbi:MAG: hypothetical protein QXQ66_05715 [Candidatus Hadarchaeum sp.]
MALVIGAMTMSILMQFVGTAERNVFRDMDVRFSISGKKLTVKVYDAASGDALGGVTIVLKYPGGTDARTLGKETNQYTFTIPMNGAKVVLVTVQVTRNGYIPWQGQVAVR